MLANLIQQKYKEYVADNRAGQRSWFFVHIPKTAGSSFCRDIAAVRSPAYNIHVDGDDRAVPHQQKLVDAVKTFNTNFTERSFQFVSGHVPVTTLMAHVDQWPDLSLMTMLRDPVKRIVSDYRYQRTSLHPLRREFIKQFPTFESFLDVTWAQNRMFQFLRPSERATVDDCIKFMIECFAFVGIVEMYPLSFRVATRLMELEHRPTSYERKTPQTEDNHVELTPDIIKLIKQTNAIDVALYDFFRAILLPLHLDGVWKD